MNYLGYDETDQNSILAYAKRLIGKTYQEIYDMQKEIIREDTLIEKYVSSNNTNKGQTANLVEEIYFGYKQNSDEEPDLKEAGVEIKDTPIIKLKNGKYSAKERLVLGMIRYDKPIQDDFYDSHAWKKCKLILLIQHEVIEKASPYDYKIRYVNYFSPPTEDLIIMIEDYEIIKNKVKRGLAGELSEADTKYLGACPKGGIANQFYHPYSSVQKRAYSFKTTYMTYILRKYIIHDIQTYEPVIKNIDDLKNTTFDSFVLGKINQYINYYEKDICKILNYNYNSQDKARLAHLVFQMLDVKSNRCEEFEKANIEVKTIRLNRNKKIREKMSFPAFDFKEFVNEDWENSEFYNYFIDRQILFVIFEENEQGYILKGAKFWNMPTLDLETAKKGWKEIQDIVKEGPKFEFATKQDGTIVFCDDGRPKIQNNFPDTRNGKINPIISIRPHADRRAYKIVHNDLYFVTGDLHKDGCELPNGDIMTKQCFWLNNGYILEQIKEFVK